MAFPVDYSEDPYGFTWGPAKVERIHSDEKRGVWFNLTTPRRCMQIHITPTGLIRTHESKRERSISKRHGASEVCVHVVKERPDGGSYCTVCSRELDDMDLHELDSWCAD